MSARQHWLPVTTALALLACANDDMPDPGPPPQPPFPVTTGTLERLVPTDTRAARTTEAPPPPISGGSVLVTADGRFAVAADPDRNRISVVDITPFRDLSLVHTVALLPGDEPGRLTEDAAGRVHVVLRGAGAVATIDPELGEVLGRRNVCPAPRGIAHDASRDQLHVVCAGGGLMQLSPEPTGMVSQMARLGGDLRDVLITGDGLHVTRFKRAELLRVDDETGAMTTLATPGRMPSLFDEPSGAIVVDQLQPGVAWRTLATNDGGYLMLHQGAREGEIPLSTEDDAEGTVTMGNPYGGGGSCSSVVQPVLTRFDGSGNVIGASKLNAALAVDVAVSKTGVIAIAQAGRVDQEQPAISFREVGSDVPAPIEPSSFFSESPSVLLTRLGDLPPENAEHGTCTFGGEDFPIHIGPVTAVTFAPNGQLVALAREPAELVVHGPFGGATRYLLLGGDSVYDTGHELFHRDVGAGVACASCHPEGGDDGHTWRFSGFGPRRTQSVNVGLEGTAPFHWAGDVPDFNALLDDVMVGRMGGVHQSAERVGALENWLYSLQPPPPVRAADDSAAERGRALFEGEAECATCHTGNKLTDSKTVDVGTGEALQVPSLVGVAHRLPVMHDGCAETLKQRFDPSCGGNEHGTTAALTEAQVDDLVAYLESL